MAFQGCCNALLSGAQSNFPSALGPEGISNEIWGHDAARRSKKLYKQPVPKRLYLTDRRALEASEVRKQNCY